MARPTTHARAQLGNAIRYGHSPETVATRRAELAEAAIQRVVDSWPPLSAETKAKLACLLLAPGGSDVT
jgi:hypothetical protein